MTKIILSGTPPYAESPDESSLSFQKKWCKTVAEDFAVVLALIKVHGPMSKKDIYYHLRHPQKPIGSLPQGIASLRMCGFIKPMVGKLQLTQDGNISMDEARQVLAIYGLDEEWARYGRTGSDEGHAPRRTQRM